MSYLKPGVYVQFQKTVGDVLLAAGVRVPAIIGTGVSYYTVRDEGVIRNSTGYPYSSTLFDKLANAATDIVGVGDYPGDNSYIENTDYILTGGVLEWIGAHKPDDSAVFYVTYQYDKPATAYQPILFSNVNDVYNEYGIASDDNTVSLGAEIAFQNGAPFVIGVQVVADLDAYFEDAIDALKISVSGIDPYVVVPISTSATVQSYLKTHVFYMSSKPIGKFRMGVVGMALSSSQSDITTRAIALGTSTSQDDGGRIVLAYDEMPRDIIQDDGSYVEMTLDSTFLACAIAGMMSFYTVQTPLTRKAVQGFLKANKARSWLETEKDIYANAGVLVLVDKGGIISVRHQLTTDTSSYNFSEISITQIRDNVSIDVVAGLDPLIGSYETPTFNAIVQEKINAILAAKLTEGVIVNYGGITVITDPSNPSNRLVAYWIDVADPINRIFITYTIKQTI